ncbi:hypothetical protein BKA56DRAFT_610894 [Ilyonectria sp. MPI-CAGE-AT-0026]|nr:hypothetical protein BKA56DRAFT_610894 [Ilyonectria sp. MPI-CAGE-AT-0026]
MEPNATEERPSGSPTKDQASGASGSGAASSATSGPVASEYRPRDEKPSQTPSASAVDSGSASGPEPSTSTKKEEDQDGLAPLPDSVAASGSPSDSLRDEQNGSPTLIVTGLSPEAIEMLTAVESSITLNHNMTRNSATSSSLWYSAEQRVHPRRMLFGERGGFRMDESSETVAVSEVGKESEGVNKAQEE